MDTPPVLEGVELVEEEVGGLGKASRLMGLVKAERDRRVEKELVKRRARRAKSGFSAGAQAQSWKRDDVSRPLKTMMVYGGV